MNRQNNQLNECLLDDGWGCDGRKGLGGCRKGCTGFKQTSGWQRYEELFIVKRRLMNAIYLLYRYQCEPCDFDLCDACVAANRAVVKTIVRESSSKKGTTTTEDSDQELCIISLENHNVTYHLFL
jgi:hypothetical protein